MAVLNNGTYGTGGIYTGYRPEHERDLSPFITAKYLLQTRGLALLPYQSVSHYEKTHSVWSNLDANTQAQKEFVRPADLTASDQASEIVRNNTSIGDALVQHSMSDMYNKYNWIDNPLGWKLQAETQKAVRGQERWLWCSTYLRATNNTVARQTAGMGLDYSLVGGVMVPLGTGLDAASSAHWSTGITDTNYRTGYTNMGGNAPNMAYFNTAVLNIALRGCTPSLAFMDSVSKSYVNGLSAARERINRRPGPEARQTSQNIETFETDFCDIDTVLCLQNFPSRAIVILDPDPAMVTWGMKSGQGIQPIPQGIQGTGLDLILNWEFIYFPFHPGSIEVLYNSKAS